VVASCSVHPVKERHRQAVQSALAQKALSEEKNDANTAVSLLLKMQEEAELVAVQEGKAGQDAAQPRNAAHVSVSYV
jgi:hypothetical protein